MTDGLQTLQIGKTIKIRLRNTFVYEGKVLTINNPFIEILDTKTNHPIALNINEIRSIEPS